MKKEMVSNSTTINKTNNDHSAKTTEHKRDDEIYRWKKTFENTEGTIKKGEQFRETGHKGYTRRRKTK
jgi:hypothetical protein